MRDLSHASTSSHGIVNYALGLAGALPAALAPGERLVLLANDEIAEALPASGSQVEVVAGSAPPRGASRVVADHVGSLVEASRRGVQVLHFPKGFVPLVNPTAARVVATLHDDIPVRYWEGVWGREHRTARTGYFAWNIRHSALHADRVLTVSDFTRNQLRRRWPQVDPVVTGQSVSLPSTPVVPVGERQPVALLFGSALPHKRTADGLAHILDWMTDHPGQGIDEVHVLGGVAGGTPSDGRVRILEGGRSNADVARLIATARVLLFPSEYEGFGLPPLEASLAGSPVVYARIPAVSEVLGADAPGGYEHGDRESFAAAMVTALAQTDDDLAGRAGELARRHRWQTVAAATVAAYRATLSGGATAR